MIIGVIVKRKSEPRSGLLRPVEVKVQRRRRERQDLIMEILDIARKGTRRTYLIQRIGLSFSQAKKYLDALQRAGFVTDDAGILKTTKNGLHVIEACEICRRLVKEVE